MKRFIPFYMAAAIIFLPLIWACTRAKSDAGKAPVSESLLTPSPEELINRGNIGGLIAFAATPEPAPGSEKQPSSFQMKNLPQQAFEKTSPISNPFNNVLLPIKPYARLYPMDFEIGVLADYASASPDEQKIIETLSGFFESLAKGEINKTVIDDPEYLKIFRFISPSVTEVLPSGYRFGKIKVTSGGEASVSVRVTSSAGTCEGTVYCLKKESTWLISDIQMDLSDYTPVDKASRFVPQAYESWMY